MVGNNLESQRFFRIRIPLYTDQGTTPNGTRFYFPDNPEIDKKIIKGIEAHYAPDTVTGDPGDLRDSRNYSGQISKTLLASLAKYVFVTIIANDLSEKNYLIPLRSLFNLNINGSLQTKKVNPYIGRVKTRSCYLIVPANAPITIQGNYDIDLTFYY